MCEPFTSSVFVGQVNVAFRALLLLLNDFSRHYRHILNPRNPTHGSGWIGSDPFYRHLLNPTKSHPRQWVDWFRSFLQTSPEPYKIPPTAVGGLVQILSTDIS